MKIIRPCAIILAVVALGCGKSDSQPKPNADPIAEAFGLNDPETLKRMNFTPLHQAAQQVGPEEIKKLISDGADVNAKETTANSTPLHQAATWGNAGAISVLVNAQAEVNAKDKHGATPLHYAAGIETGENAIRPLIEAKAEINAEDAEGQTPLFYLFNESSTESTARRAKLLIAGGAEVNLAVKDGLTPLHLACSRGAESTVQAMIDAGAKVDALDKDGDTPLHFCAQRGFASIAELLIQAKADPNLKNKSGWTPLGLAADWGQAEFVDALQKAGVSEPTWTPLHKAAMGEESEKIAALLKAEKNFDAKDAFGRTPLFWAIRCNDEKSAQLLLDAGADPLSIDNRRNSILHVAAWAGFANLVQKILDAGANAGALNDEGESPLLWAAQDNQIETVKMLLDRRVNVKVADKDGMTPLLQAVAARNVEMTKLLLDAGADVLAVNKEGKSVLNLAGLSNDKLIEMLRLAEAIATEKRLDRICATYSADNPQALKAEEIEPATPLLALQRNLRALYGGNKTAFIESFVGSESQMSSLEYLFSGFQNYLAFRKELTKAYGPEACIEFRTMEINGMAFRINVVCLEENELNEIPFESHEKDAMSKSIPHFWRCNEIRFIKKDQKWFLDAGSFFPADSDDSNLEFAKTLDRSIQKARLLIGKPNVALKDIKEAVIAEFQSK